MSASAGDPDVTRLLKAAQSGDPAARERLIPIIYEQLHDLAARQMQQQVQGHSLQPTDLVHEACLRLVDQEAPWSSRSHFFCVAAKAMRSMLVDYACARKTQKRGGDRERSPLHEAMVLFEARAGDLVALDEALDELVAFDERKARLVELRFFCGLKMGEIAEILEVSVATVEREWAVARAWLRKRVSE